MLLVPQELTGIDTDSGPRQAQVCLAMSARKQNFAYSVSTMRRRLSVFASRGNGGKGMAAKLNLSAQHVPAG